jgi:lupus La protein
VSDDGKSVRRTQPLAVGEEETINKAVEARSLYAAPFPYDATLDSASAGLAAFSRCGCADTQLALPHPPPTLPELMAFFGEHGTVNSIRLRRHVNSLDFNGSAFVEMGSVAQAEELMKKEGVVHEGATLVRRSTHLNPHVSLPLTRASLLSAAV